MEPACLPPQLEEADIHQPPTTAVTAMAAGAGGSLRRLCLARCRAVLDCRCVRVGGRVLACLGEGACVLTAQRAQPGSRQVHARGGLSPLPRC